MTMYLLTTFINSQKSCGKQGITKENYEGKREKSEQTSYHLRKKVMETLL
jgi:hypothetical protein